MVPAGTVHLLLSKSPDVDEVAGVGAEVGAAEVGAAEVGVGEVGVGEVGVGEVGAA